MEDNPSSANTRTPAASNLNAEQRVVEPMDFVEMLLLATPLPTTVPVIPTQLEAVFSGEDHSAAAAKDAPYGAVPRVHRSRNGDVVISLLQEDDEQNMAPLANDAPITTAPSLGGPNYDSATHNVLTYVAGNVHAFTQPPNPTGAAMQDEDSVRGVDEIMPRAPVVPRLNVPLPNMHTPAPVAVPQAEAALQTIMERIALARNEFNIVQQNLARARQELRDARRELAKIEEFAEEVDEDMNDASESISDLKDSLKALRDALSTSRRNKNKKASVENRRILTATVTTRVITSVVVGLEALLAAQL